MKTSPWLMSFYESYDENSRLSSRHGSVEFLTTMQYIQKYLKPGVCILEIGAGTGRYSHALAQKGYQVDAVELLEHNIRIFKENTLPHEPISITQGNALDLSGFSSNTYDITLLFGPLYHLYEKKDKQQALQEAIRVTKKGGIIFAAYVISDGCLLDEGFQRKNFSVESYIRQGLLDGTSFAAFSQPKDVFELVRKEDIDSLMSLFPVQRLHYVASDGFALLLRESIDEMNDEEFDYFMKYHLATCERPDLLGATSHALDIFQK